MIRQHARLSGVVQGVGFRPFVVREALSQGLTGWVRNDARGVELEVQGPEQRVRCFFERLQSSAPLAASLDEIRVAHATCLAAETGFRVLDSQTDSPSSAGLPADRALCSACREEILDPQARRYGYPFTNCTECGPRYSIVRGLPYDRQRTSMQEFALCSACRAEYLDVADRRFHAEPIACPACGPALQLLSGAGAEIASRRQALLMAAELLTQGKILALLGLGGFQLLVDASCQASVARLRQRKQRPERPFAVMFRDRQQLERYAALSSEALELLTSAAAPIVLVPLAEPALERLAPNVAPDCDELGAMLPYTPLHELLLRKLDTPLVCTSGNLSDEPMCIELRDGLARLGEIADAWLTHDRPIVRALDDSVARLGPEGPELLRRARGYAPLSVARLANTPCALALGAHHKNTIALVAHGLLRVSQHLGDLDSPAALLQQRRVVDDWLAFFDAHPSALACDLHPDYASTRLAEALGREWGVAVSRVQHHHAHVAAVMAEYELAGPVFGLAWDGSGLGPDRTLWGSEALLCEGIAARRFAWLESFPLVGGERAQREPRRAILGLCHQLGMPTPRQVDRWFDERERRVLGRMLEQNLNCPKSGSVGRLFDAVAALLGVQGTCSFEGQAAMKLEVLARTAPENLGSYPMPSEPGLTALEPLWQAMLFDLARGAERSRVARRFHESLSSWAHGLAERAGVEQVVLSGGCFQNRLLASTLRARLKRAGFRVFFPRVLPCNDGQIAVGQAWLAAQGRPSLELSTQPATETRGHRSV